MKRLDRPSKRLKLLSIMETWITLMDRKWASTINRKAREIVSLIFICFRLTFLYYANIYNN